MEWHRVQRGGLGVFRCKKSNKLCANVRFCGGRLYTRQIKSETEGRFLHDITKILEWKVGGAGSSTGNYLNFPEDSLLVPLEDLLPLDFQIENQRMRLKLVSDILHLARDAARKFEQHQANQLQTIQDQAVHSQTELSEQVIQSVDACLAVAETTFGRQRVDEDGRPLKLHEEETADGKPESDEGIGLCCPMDKIVDSSELDLFVKALGILPNVLHGGWAMEKGLRISAALFKYATLESTIDNV